MFSALRILRLSEVPLGSTGEDLARALDLAVLRSLTLHRCPGWENVLNHLPQSSQTIKLENLEIQSRRDTEVEHSHGVRAISTFIDTFQGLRELFVSLAGTTSLEDIWNSAILHRSTLQGIVAHVRGRPQPEELLRGQLIDVPGFSFSVPEVHFSPSGNPCNRLNLRYIGICCDPEDAV